MLSCASFDTFVSNSLRIIPICVSIHVYPKTIVSLSDIEPIFCDYANYCRYGAWCSNAVSSNNYYNYGSAAVMSRQQDSGSSCTCEHIRCLTSWYKEPICGDDGVTYPGECFLKKAACLEQTEKSKLHDGPCKITGSGKRATFSLVG